jgi:LPS O-antigen subunit length determinant protein (WzzB/FepE family)
MAKRIPLEERDKKINNAVSAFVTNLDIVDDTIYDTNNSENKIKHKNTKNDTDNDTKKDNTIEKNIVSKIKSKIKIGDLKIDLAPEKTKRIPYELKISTIEKISETSKITGLSKKDLVDCIMNSVCDYIIKKTKKNNQK